MTDGEENDRAPILAHSKSEYKRMSALGANVIPPAVKSETVSHGFVDFDYHAGLREARRLLQQNGNIHDTLAEIQEALDRPIPNFLKCGSETVSPAKKEEQEMCRNNSEKFDEVCALIVPSLPERCNCMTTDQGCPVHPCPCNKHTKSAPPKEGSN